MSDIDGSEIEPLSQTIRLRGLPFSTTAIEVEEWLIDKGVRVLRDGVELELGANGRPSGQAFADVESPEEVDVALRLHGQHMGTRYIEIFEATPRTGAGKAGVKSNNNAPPLRPYQPHHHNHGRQQQHQQMHHSHHHHHHHHQGPPPMSMGSRGRPLAHGAPAAAGGGCVVRLRGLPFDATEDDVATFLRGIAIRPHGVHLVYANDDRPSGLAYVEVETPLDVDACLGRDQQRIGHRYIEVFRSSFAEMSTGGKAPSPERSYAGAPIGKGKGFKGSAPSHRGGRAQADAPFHPYGVPITRGRR